MISRSIAVCTIFASHSLGKVKALFRSIQDANPKVNLTFFALNFDSEGPSTAPTLENCNVHFLRDLEAQIPTLGKLGFQFDQHQVRMVLKPFFLEFLLSQGHSQELVYLDPESYVFGSMDSLFQQLDCWPIILTPHILKPIPEDGATPSNQDILIQGCFNLGFFGIRKSKQAECFLNWWGRHILRQLSLQPSDGLFLDQRWLDLAPAVFPDLKVLRSKPYNVAFWNLHERFLRYESDRKSVV